MTTRDVIKECTKKFLENDGIVCCQNLTGVGALQNTFPAEFNACPNVIELPTSDVSNSGIATGMALFRPVMYVVRFAGFLWLNGCNIVNYAAKSKELWDVPCRLFVRVMSTEGNIGPVASNMHHSMIVHMPGISVAAPMTPKEWTNVWESFQDDPILCSEHRASYSLNCEMEEVNKDAAVTVFAISASRLNALEALKTINFNLVHLVWLKPLQIPESGIEMLKKSKCGIVVDGDFPNCSVAEHVAYQLMHLTGKPVYALGLEDRTAGFASHTDNLTPSVERITKEVANLQNDASKQVEQVASS